MEPVVTLAASSEKGNLGTQIEQRDGIRSHPAPGRAVGCDSHCERRETLPESDRDCQSTRDFSLAPPSLPRLSIQDSAPSLSVIYT